MRMGPSWGTRSMFLGVPDALYGTGVNVHEALDGRGGALGGRRGVQYDPQAP